MMTALLDVTMDRMEKEIGDEFENIDNAARTALAFDQQARQSATLALLNRYATRHARDYHRALNQLREIQSERRDQNDPPPSPNEELQNEPKPDLTPDPSTACDSPELATRHSPLATQTGHRPLATDHCSSETGHPPVATVPNTRPPSGILVYGHNQR